MNINEKRTRVRPNSGEHRYMSLPYSVSRWRVAAKNAFQ